MTWKKYGNNEETLYRVNCFGHLVRVYVSAGREQAAMTGERLRQSNISYSEIIHSTMDRAVETARIIHYYLPSSPLRGDDLLVEGGPVPPVPTITYWQLPQKVWGVAVT